MIVRIKLSTCTVEQLYGEEMAKRVMYSIITEACIVSVEVTSTRQVGKTTYWYLKELILGDRPIRIFRPYIQLTEEGKLTLWGWWPIQPEHKPNIQFPIEWVVEGEHPRIAASISNLKKDESTTT